MIWFSLSGGELFDRIADESYKMTESEVIKYIRQVCDALRYMHELYIVHLDIKVTEQYARSSYHPFPISSYCICMSFYIISFVPSVH